MQVEAAIAQLSIAESIDRIRETPAGYDWQQTVISQYANSPVLLQMLADFAAAVDPSGPVDAFYDNVFNVDTAVGYGLDVWGRIVGVGRVLQLPAPGADFLGFEEAADWEPFGQAPFYSGGTVTDNFALSDDAYRRLILAKALANISDGSIPAINKILMSLFSEYGNCYVTDGEDMTMTYTFGSALSVVDFAIVSQSGVLPRPAGVSATIVQL